MLNKFKEIISLLTCAAVTFLFTACQGSGKRTMVIAELENGDYILQLTYDMQGDIAEQPWFKLTNGKTVVTEYPLHNPAIAQGMFTVSENAEAKAFMYKYEEWIFTVGAIPFYYNNQNNMYCLTFCVCNGENIREIYAQGHKDSFFPVVILDTLAFDEERCVLSYLDEKGIPMTYHVDFENMTMEVME